MSDLWPAPRPTGPRRQGRLAARQQVADQPCPGAGRDRRRPERRTTSPALARHPAHGRRPRPRSARASRTPGPATGRSRPAAWDRDADVDCGLAGTVMRFVPPVVGLADGTVALRRRPPHAAAPRRSDADRSGRARCPGRRRRSGRTALRRARHGLRARRHRHHRRQRLVPVRLGAAARGRPLRPRRRRAPRRQAGAVAPPHRDDRRRCSASTGSRSTTATPTAGRSPRGRSGPSTTTSSPTCPTRRPFLALAAATGGRVTVTDWPAATTQPGDELRDDPHPDGLRR